MLPASWYSSVSDCRHLPADGGFIAAAATVNSVYIMQNMHSSLTTMRTTGCTCAQTVHMLASEGFTVIATSRE
jgi:hypothetical protein